MPPLLTLTPNAVEKVKALIAAAEQPVQGIRISVNTKGCSGMAYQFDYVTDPKPTDEMVEQDGAKVFIAPMAQMFLIGTEIDYEMDLLQAGFKFRNPNVAEACGCGESIKFKDAPAA